MEPTVNTAIDEMADIQPVILPDSSVTLPMRVDAIEQDLDINY